MKGGGDLGSNPGPMVYQCHASPLSHPTPFDYNIIKKQYKTKRVLVNFLAREFKLANQLMPQGSSSSWFVFPETQKQLATVFLAFP